MNFYDPTGSSAPVDLQVPETFHRLKRTVLLLSSALIVLAFAENGGSQALKLTVVDVSLKADIIRGLIWLAGIYYLYGFHLEARVVRLINSEAMLGAGMRTVDQALGKLSKSLDEHETIISEAAKVAKRESDSLAALQTPNDEGYVESFATKARVILGATEGAPSSKNHAKSQSDLLNRLEHFTAIAQVAADTDKRRAHALEQIAEAVRRYGDSQEPLKAALQATHKDLNRLSRRIYGDRRLGFWLWDIGGAFGAFILATLLNWPWVARVGAGIVSLTPH